MRFWLTHSGLSLSCSNWCETCWIRNENEHKKKGRMLPQTFKHCADEDTTRRSQEDFQTRNMHSQMSREQNRHEGVFFFFFFNFKRTTRSQVLLLHWPKSQHTLNPSVLSSARSKHTICFCFIQIIFTTCVLETVQPQPCSRRLSVIPPGCWRGTGWSLGPFLTVMEEPLKGPAWDRKPHSAMRRGV